MTDTDNKSAYAAAGVDIDRKMGAIERMKDVARQATTPAVLAGIGNFGGLYDASVLQGAAQPVLVARGPQDGSNHVLLLGHLDTVLPAVPPS
mgnify:CR=1 FL=1